MNDTVKLGVIIGIAAFSFSVLPAAAQTAFPPDAQIICTQQGLRTADGQTVVTAEQFSNVPSTQSRHLSIQQPGSPGTSTQMTTPAQCQPIMCPSGNVFPTCTPEGFPINYFANPCLMEQQGQNPLAPPQQVTPPVQQQPINNPPGTLTTTNGTLFRAPAGQNGAVAGNGVIMMTPSRPDRVLYRVPTGMLDPFFFQGAPTTAQNIGPVGPFVP